MEFKFVLSKKNSSVGYCTISKFRTVALHFNYASLYVHSPLFANTSVSKCFKFEIAFW